MEAFVRSGDQREIVLISLVQAGCFTTVRLAAMHLTSWAKSSAWASCSFERVVGKQEVNQSARVRAEYCISCALGLRSVGFVRERSPRRLGIFSQQADLRAKVNSFQVTRRKE
jgi:hypothetical protein